MSSEDAQAFFDAFFGHDDPFGAFGGGAGPRYSFGGAHPGVRMGGSDTFSVFTPGTGGMPSGMRSSMPGGISMGGMPFGMQPGMSSSFGGMPRAPVPRYDAIPNGTIVSLKGLVNRSDRNGDRGEIVEYDPSTGRYTIAIEDSDELIKVKPSNLLQHIHVNLQGIESQRDLNGLKGTIIAWNDHKQRYNIYVMDRSKVVSLKPTNVILEPGTVGMIVGLLAKPQLNGKYGTIKAWIKDSHRYDVQVSADQVVRVRVENIRV